MQITGTDNLIMVVFALVWDVIMLCIVVLAVSVLWRLHKALGIYIREHEPEEEEDEEDEAEKEPEEKTNT